MVSLKRFLVNVIHQAICSCSDLEQLVEAPNYSSGLERVLYTEKNVIIFFRTTIFIYLVKKIKCLEVGKAISHCNMG